MYAILFLPNRVPAIFKWDKFVKIMQCPLGGANVKRFFLVSIVVCFQLPLAVYSTRVFMPRLLPVRDQRETADSHFYVFHFQTAVDSPKKKPSVEKHSKEKCEKRECPNEAKRRGRPRKYKPRGVCEFVLKFIFLRHSIFI